nr:hypothetical protein [Tanacetum cinerariifolium]
MKQDCWLPLLHDVLKKHDWKAKSKQNKKHRNTAVGGLHTCGSRSLNSTRKYLKIKHERPVRLLVQTGQLGNGSAGAKASTSNGVGESNVVGESSGGQAVELRRVNDKSRDHMEKLQEGMTESHGENAESHPHNEEL